MELLGLVQKKNRTLRESLEEIEAQAKNSSLLPAL